MHVISRKTLRLFWEQHPESESALVRWFKILERTDFATFEALRATFPTADKETGRRDDGLSPGTA